MDNLIIWVVVIVVGIALFMPKTSARIDNKLQPVYHACDSTVKKVDNFIGGGR
jgi:hypothetical protein